LSSRLKKLENLHLSGNQYNDTVFPSLTGFSSLKSLDLSYNELIAGSGTSCRSQSLVIKVEKAGEPSSKRESIQR